MRDDIKVFTAYNRFKSPVLNAKIYKVLSHLFIPTRYSIWVDGNVFLKRPAKEFIGLLEGAEIAVFRHPAKNCLYEEAKDCMARGIGNLETIEKQIERYREEGFPERAGLGACYLIIRKHTKRIERLNEKWWAEICKGSVRDQISFPYVFYKAVKYLPSQLLDDYLERKPHKNEI